MEQSTAHPSTRRVALKALSATTLAPLSACHLFLRPKDLQPVCPNAPAVSYPGGPLTIDAHCHVFNGTDLQVQEFLSRVAAKQGGVFGFAARAIGELLENLAWKYAPSGEEELAELEKLSVALQTCTPEGHASRVGTLKQDGYERGRTQLRAALERSQRLQGLKTQRSLGALSGAPNSTDAARIEALTIVESLPELVTDYEALSSAKAQRFETYSGLPRSMATFSVQGLINFVLQNFQYRYVSVHDYLTTYNRPGTRVVDLMLPSMVDYDFWLKKGTPTFTSLEAQVRVMRHISILTNGRVHAFVPFDPLRQVAFDLGYARGDSLKLVQRAIGEDGFVGVKLYPPMGFSVLGNAERDGKGFWKQPWLPGWTDRRDLGSRLDGAMRQLFAWCESEQVPLMAHTSESNGPSAEFEALTDSRFWTQALSEFPKLRVSFGHFGSSSPVAAGMARSRAFAGLMNAAPTSPGSRAYADAGYFVEVISKEPDLQAVLRKLYEETSSKGDAALVNRFIYGTDWEMTLTEGAVKGYLEGFEKLFKELEAQPAIKSQGHTELAGRFFGLNAARWAGLFPGEATRLRLERFYSKHGIKPDWAVKVDKRSGAVLDSPKRDGVAR